MSNFFKSMQNYKDFLNNYIKKFVFYNFFLFIYIFIYQLFSFAIYLTEQLVRIEINYMLNLLAQ